MDGKWDVNNDLSVTLSVLGTDNALKHINRSMKVTDGLVGTRGGWENTQLERAYKVFFLLLMLCQD